MPRFSEGLKGRDALIAILAQQENRSGQEPKKKPTKVGPHDITMYLSMVSVDNLPAKLELIQSWESNNDAHHLMCIGFLELLSQNLAILEKLAYSIVTDKKGEFSEEKIDLVVQAFRQTLSMEAKYFAHIRGQQEQKNQKAR